MWLDAPESKFIHLLIWRYWSGSRPSLSSSNASSQTFRTIFVVGVRSVVGELSIREAGLTLLFATLSLIVAELATVSALGKVLLWAWPNMNAPFSSCHSASCVCGILLVVEVLFPRLPLSLSALAYMAPSSMVLSSFFI